MPVLFCIEDPRKYKVECYNGKLDHIFEKHSELHGFGIDEEDISKTIQYPYKSEIFLIQHGPYNG